MLWRTTDVCYVCFEPSGFYHGLFLLLFEPQRRHSEQRASRRIPRYGWASISTRWGDQKSTGSLTSHCLRFVELGCFSLVLWGFSGGFIGSLPAGLQAASELYALSRVSRNRWQSSSIGEVYLNAVIFLNQEEADRRGCKDQRWSTSRLISRVFFQAMAIKIRSPTENGWRS